MGQIWGRDIQVLAPSFCCSDTFEIDVHNATIRKFLRKHSSTFLIKVIEIKIQVSKNRNFRKLESLTSYARQHLAMNKHSYRDKTNGASYTPNPCHYETRAEEERERGKKRGGFANNRAYFTPARRDKAIPRSRTKLFLWSPGERGCRAPSVLSGQ